MEKLGNKRDEYDFMRFNQLTQTDSLFRFVAPSWMNDLLQIDLYLAFFQSLWSSCQAFDAPKNIKDFVL